jgi:hypothetical protein
MACIQRKIVATRETLPCGQDADIEVLKIGSEDVFLLNKGSKPIRSNVHGLAASP